MSITVYRRPEELPESCLLADCAVSGGTLEAFIRGAMEAAHGRLCLRILPVYADFPLPCSPGQEQMLARDAAATLGQSQSRHYSQALGTEYFTYTEHGRLHAVLYDTQDTLRGKLRLADSLGVPCALVPQDFRAE